MKSKRTFFETLRAACALISLPRNMDFAFVPELKSATQYGDQFIASAQMSFESLGQRLTRSTSLT